ncbi:MAG: hypothetical protein JWN37_788 [Candidatus Nomurabacteria bacterium]|nr:hypothetical protein [Candidatus Nomurabacteria bacterium]
MKYKLIILATLIIIVLIGLIYVILASSKYSKWDKKGFPLTAITKEIKDDIFTDPQIYIIDDSLIFIKRSGGASDYSFHHILFDKDKNELCSYADNFAGPKIVCKDESKRYLFEIIIKNIDKPNLGLEKHKVEVVTI